MEDWMLELCEDSGLPISDQELIGTMIRFEIPKEETGAPRGRSIIGKVCGRFFSEAGRQRFGEEFDDPALCLIIDTELVATEIPYLFFDGEDWFWVETRFVDGELRRDGTPHSYTGTLTVLA